MHLILFGRKNTFDFEAGQVKTAVFILNMAPASASNSAFFLVRQASPLECHHLECGNNFGTDGDSEVRCHNFILTLWCLSFSGLYRGLARPASWFRKWGVPSRHPFCPLLKVFSQISIREVSVGKNIVELGSKFQEFFLQQMWEWGSWALLSFHFHVSYDLSGASTGRHAFFSVSLKRGIHC